MPKAPEIGSKSWYFTVIQRVTPRGHVFPLCAAGKAHKEQRSGAPHPPPHPAGVCRQGAGPGSAVRPAAWSRSLGFIGHSRTQVCVPPTVASVLHRQSGKCGRRLRVCRPGTSTARPCTEARATPRESTAEPTAGRAVCGGRWLQCSRTVAGGCANCGAETGGTRRAGERTGRQDRTSAHWEEPAPAPWRAGQGLGTSPLPISGKSRPFLFVPPPSPPTPDPQSQSKSSALSQRPRSSTDAMSVSSPSVPEIRRQVGCLPPPGVPIL